MRVRVIVEALDDRGNVVGTFTLAGSPYEIEMLLAAGNRGWLRSYRIKQ